MLIFIMILSGVLLNAAAQLLLKAGMLKIGYFEFSIPNAFPIGLKIMQNPPILMGISMYVLSLAIWLMVLSRVQVSYAYPLVSIGYIVNAVAAYFLFGEPLTSMRMLGIMIIIAGVCLISQSQ